MSAPRRHRVSAEFFLPSWMISDGLPIMLANDVRAALPAWMLGMLLVSAGFLPFGESAGVLGYMIGCSALGAIMAGHDFTHRTVLFALSQPIEHAQIWRRRMGVAFFASLPIALIAAAQTRTFEFISPGAEGLTSLARFLAPMLTGVCVVPWVTLLARSTLAGAVFCVPLPFAIAFVSQQAANLRFGSGAWMEPGWLQFRASMNCFLLLAVSLAGAALGRRTFLRLEAIEPRASFASARKARAVFAKRVQQKHGAPGPAWWQLACKETRLLGLALVPAAGLAATLLSWQFRERTPEIFPILTGFWAFFCCVLIGAMASAEERQVGLIQSQALLPMAAWKQWGIKAAVCLGASAVLVLMVPVLVLHFGPWRYPVEVLARAALWNAPPVFVLVLASLYFSTLAPNSMQAILLALPACGILLAALPSDAFWRTGEIPLWIIENRACWPESTASWAMAGGALVLLAAGRRNHFNLESSVGTVARQLFPAAAAALFVALAANLVRPISFAPSAGDMERLGAESSEDF